MTRNSTKISDADDPWGQLEADLFGIEVGKEHTAHERVVSEPIFESPPDVSNAIPKPLEDDDFGDFGAGLVEEMERTPRRAHIPVQPMESAKSERPAKLDRASSTGRTTDSAGSGDFDDLEAYDRPTKSSRSESADREKAGRVETERPVRSEGSPSKPVRVAKSAPKKPFKDDLADFSFDEDSSDDELEAAIEIDDEDLDDDTDEDTDVEASAVSKGPPSPEDDPYWDALANWNWQEDDRPGKPRTAEDRARRPGSSTSRPTDRTPPDGLPGHVPSRVPVRAQGDRPSRGRKESARPERSASDRSLAERATTDHVPPPVREARPTSASAERSGERTPTVRRSAPERDDAVESPRLDAAAADEPEVEEEIIPDVSSRRRDRRRSRRQVGPASSPAEEQKTISLDDLDPDFVAGNDAWPAEIPETRTTSFSASPEAVAEEDLDFDQPSAEEGESEEEELVEGGEDQPRRKRSRRRRRRPESGPGRDSGNVESNVDEDIKHLEDDGFGSSLDDDLDSEPSPIEGDEEEESSEDRARRPRRRRRRVRNDRAERPAEAPAARRSAPHKNDSEVESELVDSEIDEESPFVEDTDFDFEADEPPRAKRPSRRPARPAVVVIRDEDDDDDGEPEPLISYDDVPSWEEAISYLLNPTMVESFAGDRASSERGVENRGGDRIPDRPRPHERAASERAPREPSARDNGPRENAPRENAPREGGPREGGQRPGRRPRRDS